MITGQQVVEAARAYLGTPFHHQARRKGVGLDCVGLIVLVARDLGIPLRDHPTLDYARVPTAIRHLGGEVPKQFRPVPVDQRAPGDVLLFAVHRKTLPQHIGIYTGNGNLIHAWHEASRVIETALGPYWEERVLSVHRYPGVE